MDDIMVLLFLAGVLVILVGIGLLIAAYATKQKMKLSFRVIAAGILLFAGAIVVSRIQVHQEEVADEKAQAARLKLKKEMDKDFKTSHSAMLIYAYDAASNAEKLGNKVNHAWSDAIYEDTGATVGGKHYTDFNDAVNAVIKTEQASVDKIAKDENAMAEELSTMNSNLTNTNRTKYKSAKKLATAVKQLDNSVTSPSGNLDNFSDDFSEKDHAVADLIKE